MNVDACLPETGGDGTSEMWMLSPETDEDDTEAASEELLEMTYRCCTLVTATLTAQSGYCTKTHKSQESAKL